MLAKTKTFIILGPTCAGKTSLGVKLCREFNGLIISADSRQVVRCMDIGTGKVPALGLPADITRLRDRWVLSGVDIYGYDLVDPNEYFSAYDFLGFCKKILLRAFLDGRNVFVVGGTGLYIDTLAGRVPLAGVGPNMALRRNAKSLSVDELGARLLKLSSEVYKKIDVKNPVRIIRAIEKLSVKDVSEEKASLLKDPIFVGLTSDREVLYARADAWIDSIFKDELFNEVAFIESRFPNSHRLKGLIYKSVVSYLSRATSLEESKQQAKYDTHAYIRRQLTWFRRNSDINWFDISAKNFDDQVLSLVKSEINGR